MIISGGSRSNWRYFAKHLMKTEENERVEVSEIRGLIAENVLDAFREMDALAIGTRLTNFFYHADINPREGEELTPEQWEQAVDTLEKNLRLDGQPRFVVEHEKEGRTHRHVVWLRVDLDTLKAIPDSWDYTQHQKTSRALEQAFGLEPVNGVLGPDGKRVKRRPKNQEVMRGDRSGIDPNDVTAELTALWHQADTGQAFAAALEERGYILAKGDRRDFVVVDQAGHEHSLARRIDGAKAAQVRERMADVDRDTLPSVAEARAMARDRISDSRDERTARSSTSDRSSVDRVVQGIVEEVVYSTLEHSAAPRERPEVEPSRDSEQRPAAPVAPPPQSSVFDLLARKLTEAVHAFADGPTIAESLDPLAQPSPPSPSHRAPGRTEPSAFDRAARELIRDAKEAAPVIADLSAAVEAEPPAFEHLVQTRNQALRDAGGSGLFMSAGLAWIATKIKPVSDAPLVGRHLTPFEHRVQETNQALRANGGEPYTTDRISFWERTVSQLMDARDRVADWIRDTAQGFAERLLQSRKRDSDNHERDR